MLGSKAKGVGLTAETAHYGLGLKNNPMLVRFGSASIEVELDRQGRRANGQI
jgi:hypothetical protein